MSTVNLSSAARTLANRAGTPAGRAYLQKYLHPPGGSTVGNVMCPDNTATARIAMEDRGALTINTVGPAGTPWHCLVATIPEFTVRAFVWKWTGVPDIGLHSATDFTFQTLQSTQTLADNAQASFRTIYGSETITLDSSATANQGTVACCSNTITADVVTTAGAVAYCVFPPGVPPTQSMVATSTPTAVIQPAREGVFGVEKLNAPVNLFRRTPSPNDPQSSICLGYSAPVAANMVWNIVATVAAPTVGTMEHSFNTNIYYFTNLDSTAALVLRYIRGLEFVPSAGGLLKAFAVVPPPADPLILQLCHDCSRGAPDAYPASANARGVQFSGRGLLDDQSSSRLGSAGFRTINAGPGQVAQAKRRSFGTRKQFRQPKRKTAQRMGYQKTDSVKAATNQRRNAARRQRNVNRIAQSLAKTKLE